MNKILTYTVIAILLGSVTMVVPLALLGPNNLIPADSKDNVLGAGEETAMRNDTVPSYEITTQQTNDTEGDTFSQKSGVGEADVASGLSSMGLIVVPGFVVALGVFVYFKKRTV